VKTYNTDAQVADSAGTMSAIVTGVKTRIGHISVAAAVPHDDCAAALAQRAADAARAGEQRGLATGVVTTTRITHATPAATYAHVPEPQLGERRAAAPEAGVAAGCRDIARQLVEFDHGDGIEVVLGGGRAAFCRKAPPIRSTRRSGVRADGRNLHRRVADGGRRPALRLEPRRVRRAVAPDDGQVLGLFEPSHMRYEADRGDDPAGEPSLAEMTAFAIAKLAARGNGYFLMVEGGRIDHATMPAMPTAR
jgi:alkaline phosphatase